MLRVAIATALTFCVLPTAAQAATVTDVLDSSGRHTITYLAHAGEANDLSVDFVGGTVFTDAGASITAGAGCTASSGVATCPAAPWLIDVSTRNRDDRATILGYPHVENIRFSGGAGNDTANMVAVLDTELHGDAGDDVLTAEGDVTAIADGGPGDDVVTVTPFIASGYAIGGPGRDRLLFRAVGGLASYVEMDGGNGADVLIAQPAAKPGSTLDGAAGNDVIVIEDSDPLDGTGFTVSGGTGGDTIDGGPLADTIDAGPGGDAIDVRGGGADTVTCGSGVDTVFHDATDVIAADCEVS